MTPSFRDQAHWMLDVLRKLSLGCVFLSLCLGLNVYQAQAETLRAIQKRGVFRIGVKNNLPLLGQDDGGGTLTGFEIEFAQAIAHLIWGEDRIKLDFIPLLNQERLPAIANGTVDIAIANIHITEPRRRVVTFSQPYLESQTSFVAKNQATLATLKDSRIGVLQGSVAIGRVKMAFPNAQLIGLTSYQAAIEKLHSQEIDSFAGDRLILKGWQFGSAKHAHFQESWSLLQSFQFFEDGIGKSQIAIAMPKGLQHRNLHQAVNLAIDTLESSGQLQQMRNKWRLSEVDATPVVRLDTFSMPRSFVGSSLNE